MPRLRWQYWIEIDYEMEGIKWHNMTWRGVTAIVILMISAIPSQRCVGRAGRNIPLSDLPINFCCEAVNRTCCVHHIISYHIVSYHIISIVKMSNGNCFEINLTHNLNEQYSTNSTLRYSEQWWLFAGLTDRNLWWDVVVMILWIMSVCHAMERDIVQCATVNYMEDLCLFFMYFMLRRFSSFSI